MIDYTRMDSVELINACGEDARTWAEAFLQHHQSLRSRANLDVEDMTGWFANAMCTAVDCDAVQERGRGDCDAAVRRVPGSWRGQVKISDDFDAPLSFDESLEKTAIVAWLREVAGDAEEQGTLFSVEQILAIRVCADMLEKYDAWRNHLVRPEPEDA